MRLGHDHVGALRICLCHLKYQIVPGCQVLAVLSSHPVGRCHVRIEFLLTRMYVLLNRPAASSHFPRPNCALNKANEKKDRRYSGLQRRGSQMPDLETEPGPCLQALPSPQFWSCAPSFKTNLQSQYGHSVHPVSGGICSQTRGCPPSPPSQAIRYSVTSLTSGTSVTTRYPPYQCLTKTLASPRGFGNSVSLYPIRSRVWFSRRSPECRQGIRGEPVPLKAELRHRAENPPVASFSTFGGSLSRWPKMPGVRPRG